MQKRNITILFIAIILLLPQVVHAVEVTYPPVIGAQPPQIFTETHPQEEWFALYLRYGYHLILNLTGIACLYALATGGVGYLFYNWIGNPGAAAGMLGKINIGLIGAGLTLGSFLILNTLNPQLLEFRQDLVPIDLTTTAVPDPGGAYEDYLEIPIGKLIEQVEDRAGPVKDQAVIVNGAAQQVRDQSACIKDLTDQCTCSTLEVEGCECTDPTNCPECTAAGCLGDPCDVTGRLCSGGSGNIREALNSARASLSALIDTLTVQKEILVAMNNNLIRANENLKLAEGLVRDRDTTGGLHNYMSFVDVKQQHRENDETVRVQEIWPWEEDIPLTETFREDVITRYVCDNSCSAKPGDTTPCCILCEDTLICYGNDFKCDENNTNVEKLCSSQCFSDEEFPVSDLGNSESGGWPRQVLEETIMYNGYTFPVPSGGVRYCDINKEGCLHPKCEL